MRDAMASALDPRNITSAGDAVQGLVDHVSTAVNSISSLSSHVNLTTGLEAQMQHLSTETRRMGANFGHTGAQLSRFSSQAAGLAFSLNISAQQAADSVEGFIRNSSELGVVGIRNAGDMARFVAGFGVTADTLGGRLHELRQGLGLTDAQIRTVMGSTVGMGRATGNVNAAVEGMGESLNLLRSEAANSGAALDGMGLAHLAAQTNAASAGFYSISHNAEDARRNSMELARTMLQSRTQLNEMFAGGAQDLHAFTTSMGILEGSATRAFEHMRQGPAEFMQDMARMVQEARASGRMNAASWNMLRSSMTQAIGPEQAEHMVEFFRSANDESLRMMSSVEGATADLGRMGREAQRSGRTLQESFDLIKQSGVAAFRSIGRHEAVALVHDMSSEFGRFNHSMREVVAQGGPMGMFVEKLSAIHQIGALALIPHTLRPMAVLFGTITENLGPAVEAFHNLGFDIHDLFSPMALLTGAVSVLAITFLDIYMRTGNVHDAFSKLGDKVREWFGIARGFAHAARVWIVGALDSLSERFLGFAATFDWKQFFKSWFARAGAAVGSSSGEVRGVVGLIWEEVSRAFTGGQAKTAIGRILGRFVAGARSVLEGLGGAISEINWTNVVNRAMQGLADALAAEDRFLQAIPWSRIFQSVFDGVKRAVAGLGSQTVREWLDQFVRLLGQRERVIADAVLSMMRGAIEALGQSDLSDMVRSLSGTILHLADSIVTEMIGVLGTLVDQVPHLLTGLVDSLQAMDLPRLWSDLAASLLPLVASTMQRLGPLVERALAGLIPAVAHAMEALNGVLMRMPGLILRFWLAAIPVLVHGLSTLLQAALAGIRTGLVSLFPSLQGPITGLFDFIIAGVRLFERVFMFAWRAQVDFVTHFGDHVRAIFGGLLGFLRVWFGGAILIGTTAFDALRAGFEFLGTAARAVFNRIVTAIFGDMESAKAHVTGFRDHFIGALDGIWGRVMSVFGHSVNSVVADDLSKTNQVSSRWSDTFQGHITSAFSTAQAASSAFATGASAVVRTVVGALTDAIASALVGSFRNGFTGILRASTDFGRRLRIEVTSLTADIQRQFEAMFRAIQRNAEGALQGITQQLERVSRQITAAINAAHSASTAANAASVAAGTGVSPLVAVRPLGHSASNDDLYNAVHAPDWYYRDYAPKFDAKMNQLIAAVERNGSRSAPQGGRTSEGGGASRQANDAAGAGVNGQ